MNHLMYMQHLKQKRCVQLHSDLHSLHKVDIQLPSLMLQENCCAAIAAQYCIAIIQTMQTPTMEDLDHAVRTSTPTLEDVVYPYDNII